MGRFQRCTRDHQVRIAADPVAGLRWSKTPSSMGKISAAEILRLRATSAVSRDQSVRRFAQDDDSVGELTERKPCAGAGRTAVSSASLRMTIHLKLEDFARKINKVTAARDDKVEGGGSP
jgi:hypothetical protein